MKYSWQMAVFKFERIGWSQGPTKKSGAGEKTNGENNQLIKGKTGSAWICWVWSSCKIQVEESEAWRRVWAESVGNHRIGEGRAQERGWAHELTQGRACNSRRSGDRRADVWRTSGPRRTQGQESGITMQGDQYQQTTDSEVIQSQEMIFQS